MAGSPYIEFTFGTIPIILTCPHGGQLMPDEVLDRTEGCFEWDFNTLELCNSICTVFNQLPTTPSSSTTTIRPFVIRNLLHRKKLDPNRKQEDACHKACLQSNGAWRAYHSSIEVAIAYCQGVFGFCHVFDIHGQSHRKATELGYLVRTADLMNTDTHIDATHAIALGSSLATLYISAGTTETTETTSSTTSTTDVQNHPPPSSPPPPPSLSQLLRGETSLGGVLQKHGYAALPSPAIPTPTSLTETYFWGAHTTWRYGCVSDVHAWNGDVAKAGKWGPGAFGRCTATQIETEASVRANAETMTQFSIALVDAMLVFMHTVYGWAPN